MHGSHNTRRNVWVRVDSMTAIQRVEGVFLICSTVPCSRGRQFSPIKSVQWRSAAAETRCGKGQINEGKKLRIVQSTPSSLLSDETKPSIFSINSLSNFSHIIFFCLFSC